MNDSTHKIQNSEDLYCNCNRNEQIEKNAPILKLKNDKHEKVQPNFIVTRNWISCWGNIGRFVCSR